MNRPLHDRDWWPWFAPVACGAVGWLWHRPMTWPEALVSILVGGAAVWFVLGSRISFRLLRQTSRPVSITWFVLSIAGLWFGMNWGLPRLFAVVS